MVIESGWKLLKTIFYHIDIFVKTKMCPRKTTSKKSYCLELAVVYPVFIIP